MTLNHQDDNIQFVVHNPTNGLQSKCKIICG